MRPLVLQESDPFLWQRLKGLPPDTVCVTRTDTIYGLGCRYDNPSAKDRILSLKNRSDNKFIVLVSNLSRAQDLCELAEEQIQVLNKYWPASISFVLKGRGPEPTLALRQPNLPFAKNLIDFFGGAMISTSCNVSGLPPVKNIEEAVALFGDKVEFYIDSGQMSESKASTIVDLTTTPPQVLRAGEIPFP